MNSIEESQTRTIAIQEETISTLERMNDINTSFLDNIFKVIIGSVLFFGVVSLIVIGLLISIL